MPTINYIEKLYALEEGSVKDLEILDDSFLIHIQFKRKVHICPNCCRTTYKIKDYHLQKIKLDSINTKPTYALVNKRRYYCPHCHKSFYEKTFISARYQRRSQSQVFHIINECAKKQSFTDIAKRYDISITTVIRYFSMTRVIIIKEIFQSSIC